MPHRHMVHIVDDDDSLRKALGRLLEASGFQVALYSSAAHFLERNTDESRGCLLLDIHMPNMTGLELQAFMNNRKARMPIIFITGAENDPLDAATKDIPTVVLSKPVEKNALIDAIKHSLSQPNSINAHPRSGHSPEMTR